MHRNEVSILLVEDSDEDYNSIMWAFRQVGIQNTVFLFSEGDDALDFLLRQGKYSGIEDPLPGLIMLDLNLPGTDGREILKKIKSHDRLRIIPIVILTSSTNPRDIELCYTYGANSYLTKSMDFDKFLNMVQGFKEFWLQRVSLPPSSDQIK